MTMPVFGMDRQDRRIGRATVGAEGRQDHLQHLVVAFQHADQRGVEAAGGVVVGGRGELVLKAKGIQERAQPGVVVRAETVVGAERDPECGSAAGRDTAASISLFGTLSGTLRNPSMSSLKASSFDGRPVMTVKACRTQEVRATSPNVPICGRPEGP
jgi:hypothetical protein